MSLTYLDVKAAQNVTLKSNFFSKKEKKDANVLVERPVEKICSLLSEQFFGIAYAIFGQGCLVIYSSASSACFFNLSRALFI